MPEIPKNDLGHECPKCGLPMSRSDFSDHIDQPEEDAPRWLCDGPNDRTLERGCDEAVRDGQEREARLEWLLKRAVRYIGEHCPTEDLQHEIRVAIAAREDTERPGLREERRRQVRNRNKKKQVVLPGSERRFVTEWEPVRDTEEER